MKCRRKIASDIYIQSGLREKSRSRHQRLGIQPPTYAIIRARLRLRWPQSATNSRGNAISCIPYVHIIRFRNRAFYNKRKSARESSRVHPDHDDC